MFNPFWVHNKVSVYLFVTCIATIISRCEPLQRSTSSKTIFEKLTRISTSIFQLPNRRIDLPPFHSYLLRKNA